MRSFSYLLFALIVLVIAVPVSATIIDVPDDYSTIQEGIDAGTDGDTVLVQPGTYEERINFNGHNIVLGSLFLTTEDVRYIASTIIDAGGAWMTVVTFNSGEDSTAVIMGFTIQNGNTGGVGGGISCFNNSSPRIIRCNILNNASAIAPDGAGLGGGIGINSSSPIIKECILIANFAMYRGGAIYCGDNSEPLIINNVICENGASISGAAVYSENSSPIITNNIIRANYTEYGDVISGPSIVSYCNVQGGWEGEGNIDCDPQFSDKYYNTCAQSPCINAGDPDISDPDGTRSDIGLFFYEHPECYVGDLWYVSIEGNDMTGDGSQGNPFQTIQHGIDISVPGDSVIVENGTFVENITIMKDIVLASNFVHTNDTLDIQNTVIDGESSGTIVTFRSYDSIAAIIGLTVTNGGGIFCRYSNPAISNNIVSNNSNGIGCKWFSSPTISDNTIINNLHRGITCESNSSPIIDGNLIDGNSTNWGFGGGIYSRESNPTITNNTISNNNVNNNSYGGGAGIYCYDSEAEISDNIIINNFVNSDYPHNYGGGIYCGHSDLIISNNIICGNSAGWGGAIYCTDASFPLISNNIICYSQRGVGIYCDWSSPEIINNTVSDNYGGALTYRNSSSPVITNSILWGNIYGGSGSPVITYSDVLGGWEGEGNIDVNPLFFDPYEWEYNVCAQSPCIDAGDPNIFDPDGTRSDIGAFFPEHPECIGGSRWYVSFLGNDSTGDGSPEHPFRTIQHGIDVAVHGDSVIVGFGYYVENITCTKSIVIGSNYIFTGDTLDIESTVIDGDSSGAVVSFESPNSMATITGFTITNGWGWPGAGIYCRDASPTIRKNVIRGNKGGIECGYLSNPKILENTIIENWDYNGGGILCVSTNSTIISNIISANSATRGGGIYLIAAESSYPQIIGNTISGNSADTGGGLYCGNNTYSTVVNTIFWANEGIEGDEIHIDPTSTLEITYSDIQGGWEGEGNIDADPLFRDPENGDFHLMATSCGDPENSPCIDAGDPSVEDIFLDCSWGLGELRSDMGAYGGGDSTMVDIDEQEIGIPQNFALFQNYPNPFNPATTIEYALPEGSDVKIEIYDILGRKAQTLFDDYRPAGVHKVIFDASGISSGVYFYRVYTGEMTETKKMLLLK